MDLSRVLDLFESEFDDYVMTPEEEEAEIAEHVRKCKKDGFCYVCQCL